MVRSHGTRLHVGIVDNDPLTLLALRAMVNRLSNHVVVTWAVRDGDEAVERCVGIDDRPNVLLVDMSMDGVDGGTVCQRIRHLTHDIVIYGMTSHSPRQYTGIAQRFGAQALLDKADAGQLRRCLIACAEGTAYVQNGFDSPAQAHRRLSSARRPSEANVPLSPRETEILDWTIEGLTAREVARKMAISESTVKTHIRHAIAKLGVHSKLQLIRTWTQYRQMP